MRARIQDAKGAEEWIVGRLVDADDASVTIRSATGDAVVVPLRRLDRLDRSLGRRSARRGALRGAGLGFASGAVLGALAGAVGSDGGRSPACDAPPRGDAQWLEAAVCGASLGRGPESATMGAAVLGTAGAVLNAANEAAVAAFLAGEIPFMKIVPACQSVLQHHPFDSNPTLEELLRLDRWARQEITRWICS